MAAQATEGRFLYALDSQSTLRVIEIQDAVMRLRGSLRVPGDTGGARIRAANAIVYVPLRSDPRGVLGGYATIDVSDPDHPALLNGSTGTLTANSPGTALALSGSGLGLLVGRAAGAGGAAAANVADLLNVSAVTNQYTLLTRFALPGTPAHVTIASGTAFIADGEAGLVILNYEAFDTGGKPPTVSVAGIFADTDATNASTALIEGARFLVRVNLADDAQVRNVELLVNGQVVQNSVAPPFALDGLAPSIIGTANTLTIQVRATDTGGNVGISAPSILRLLPDTTPPVLVKLDPQDGDEKFRGFDTVRLVLSEPLANASLAAPNFEIADAGGKVFRRPRLPTSMPIRRWTFSLPCWTRASTGSFSMPPRSRIAEAIHSPRRISSGTLASCRTRFAGRGRTRASGETRRIGFPPACPVRRIGCGSTSPTPTPSSTGLRWTRMGEAAACPCPSSSAP